MQFHLGPVTTDSRLEFGDRSKDTTPICNLLSASYGGVAQLGERVLCKHEVASSTLVTSTYIRLKVKDKSEKQKLLILTFNLKISSLVKSASIKCGTPINRRI